MSKSNTKGYVRNWSYEVSAFSRKVKQPRYRNTWRWEVGFVDNLMPSFPIFTIMKSSHGYKRLKFGSGHKGPVIKTKAEAIRQAKAALKEAKAEYAKE
jgi:hypothetical protein